MSVLKSLKEKKLNKQRAARSGKLAVLYLLWIVVPLVITDGLFVFLLERSERADIQYGYERAAEATEYLLKSNIDYAMNMTSNVSLSSKVNDFLSTEYANNYDYFQAYQNMMDNTYLKSMYNVYNASLEIYADNDTIIAGGGVYPLSEAINKGWYKAFLESGNDNMLLFYYDKDDFYVARPKRRMFFISRGKYYQHGNKEKIIKLELDYATMARNFEKLGLKESCLLCQDGKISIATSGQNNVFENYEDINYDSVAYTKDFSYGGSDFKVLVNSDENTVLAGVKNNAWFLTILIAVNAIVPVIFARLTQSIQKARLEQQETDIARQNAELHALHSQINPHFLFNALESIRMHSVLKGEDETADMVRMLAVIERKNADWNEDKITIVNEMEFAEAYLKLQQYRFGDRLSYEIDIEEGCEGIMIPRLSIVTFVENACVHGIEGKSSPGWIFVRVYTEDDNLVLEIEDTGEGIPEDELNALKDKMENASIDKLKEKGRIGVINACLRLKMATDGTVRFNAESEEGIGTTISIVIGRSYLD